MQLTANPTLLFASIPKPDEQIEPDLHFELVNRDIDLENAYLGGGVLIQTLLLSSEPYLRFRFRDPSYIPDMAFVPPVQLGFPVDSAGIGKVVRSEDPCFQVGDIVIGYLDYTEYCIYPGPGPHMFKLPIQKLNPHPEIPYSVYLGVLGFPGHVAYSAWELYVKERTKTAKTMYISAGASTVGTFVIEYTKLKAPHVKIIASASTDEKVGFMKKSGASVAFNYKSEDIGATLRKHGPIDIYWDNVGGKTLDAALVNMRQEGLVLSCGSMSTMPSPHDLQNYDQVFQRKLTVQGLICYAGQMAKPMATFFQDIIPLVLDGTISHREHLYHGMEEAARALCDPHKGANTGKAVIVVCDE